MKNKLMNKWEYKIKTIQIKGWFNKEFDEDEINELLDKFGKYGWELVNSIPIIQTTITGHANTSGVTFIFKRKLED